MATKPKSVSLTNDAIKILNGIRNQASSNYKDYIPVATDGSSIKEIGAIVMQFEALQNEFVSALINRIGLTVITSRSYENPIAMFKKGMLEFGESVEEVFVNIAEAYEFDPEDAETTLYKRYIPDVKSAFHVMNFQKFYPVSVSEVQLKQAFLSADGLYDLVAKITESLYTAMNNDEFLVMKYVMARRILNGATYPIQIDGADTTKAVTSIKGASNDLEFLTDKYNPAGVYTHSEKDRQYLIVTSKFDAKMDVETLATAFNMDKASFLGHKVMIDGFDKLDVKRLSKLLKDNPYYTEPTEAELKALSEIPAILVDEDFFMVYDNLLLFKQQENGKGLYWNYFLHSWKTFSTSPYAGAITFVPEEPTVVSVDVNPTAVTVAINGTSQVLATVETTGFASKECTWVIDNTDVASVDSRGVVTGLTAGTATLTVTSIFDESKSATATITVA